MEYAGAAAFEDATEDGINHTFDADTDSQSGDSALGEDLAESTLSLRESLYSGVDENGRKYHKYKEGSYILPSDDTELDRLDLQHQLFLMTTDYKLHLAPIKERPEWVLDIGTGTGIWAIDFAAEYPDTEIIGVDLSPSQPDFVPTNCRFEIDDVEEEWTWGQKFDYIHARMMTASFSDYPKFFRQAFDHLQPGAFLEMQDQGFPPQCQDGTLKRDSALSIWADKIVSALGMFGKELASPKYKQYMLDAGFVDVVEVQYIWPQNTWPKDKKLKELGRWHLANALDGLEGFSMALCTRAHGMTTDEVQLLMMDVRKDMKDKSIHAYWPMYYVYGRKPTL
ncbi:hypothetical protein EG328_006418 [Venturia inaequalis]|uniref:S-adenosyl-L-methionine-dependent methyltransferase n=1 Tax=Venturia inaequalis TaxID=5025 RepID=A0A8H3VMT7_VENIN|nr:hypothetical protein EG328_006418 [Venturia inaequalis]KAE9990696.1 hypothetical protein EG327_001043 [Venturia inaequalis]